MQRLQKYYVRPEEIDYLSNDAISATPELSGAIDRDRVRKAVSGLPALERNIMREYIYSDPPSERALAERFSPSRYRVRELLVDGLGRVLVSLGRPEQMPKQDWDVALALWRDGRSVDEASKHLGITKRQLRAANARNYRFLTESLGNYQPGRGRDIRRQEMKSALQQEVVTLTPLRLFEATVRSPGDTALLRQLEEQAAEVIAALDGPGEVGIADAEISALDHQWVARVYEALGRAAGETDIPLEAEQELFYAHADAEYRVGEAYKQSLIPGLPPELADLAGNWLVRLPLVSDDEARDALESPSGRGALPLSESLSRYGVTPMTVLDTTEAVAKLVERLLRRGRLDQSLPVTLSDMGINDGSLVDERLIVGEISRVAVCREPTAQALYEWSRQVAGFKPLLFGGFRAELAHGGAVVLTRVGKRPNELHQRWGISHAVEEVMAYVG